MSVYVRKEFKKFNLNTWALKKWMQFILDQLECRDKELSILLVNDEKIRKLNYQYRQIDKTTDVLSFPQKAIEKEKFSSPLLGDVVVSTETAWRQSITHNLSFEEEVVLLLIHGILHLLGYDHERSSQEARQMKDKTRTLFKTIFPNTDLAKARNY